jgi:hypothetical protein
MFTVKAAVCSEICTKYINAIWTLWRIIYCWTWWYVKLQLGFKSLKYLEVILKNYTLSEYLSYIDFAMTCHLIFVT